MRNITSTLRATSFMKTMQDASLPMHCLRKLEQAFGCG